MYATPAIMARITCDATERGTRLGFAVLDGSVDDTGEHLDEFHPGHLEGIGIRAEVISRRPHRHQAPSRRRNARPGN